MKFQAMYIGKKPVDQKEREYEGRKIPAFKGTQYTFLVNEWDKEGTLGESFGRQYMDKREKGSEIEEIEKGAIKPGELVKVNIQTSDINTRFVCELEGMDEIPF